MTKRFLFVASHAPRSGAIANEALDLLLVAASFGLEPAVLFSGDGVYQLVVRFDDEPTPESEGRNVSRALTALPTYDVTRIYADAASLEERGLVGQSLLLDPVVLDRPSVQRLIAEQDVVFSG